MKNCSLGRLGKGAIKFCINYIHYRNLHRIKIPLEVGRFSSFFILSKLSAWLRLGLISIFIRIGWSNIEGSRSHMGRWTSKKLRYYPHIIKLQRYKNPDRRAIPSPLECNDYATSCWSLVVKVLVAVGMVGKDWMVSVAFQANKVIKDPLRCWVTEHAASADCFPKVGIMGNFES